LRALNRWQWILILAIVWYVWHFTYTSLRVHYGLGTSAYDYGLYDQGIWLLSRFKAPFVTLMGRNLFADHGSLILFLVVPLYWVVPGAGTLLFLQSLGLAGGAIPVYLLARKRLGSEPVAALLGVLFLLHPALSWTNLEEFHPDAFLPTLFGFALYFALEGRWKPYGVFLVLSLLVKEDVMLVTIPLGIWVALRRDRFLGAATVAISLAVFAFDIAMLMGLSGEAFPNAWRVPFGGVTGLIGEGVSRPGNVLDYVLSDGRPWYLWQLLFPFAFLCLLGPGVAAISGLVVLSNVMSTYWYQYHIQYHYTVVALPALAMAAVWGLGRIPTHRRRWLLVGLTVATLWSAFLWADLPHGRSEGPRWTPSHPVAIAAFELTELVPDDAVVSAHYAVTPHFTRREQVYMFPNPFSTVMYGTHATLFPEGRRLAAADEVEYVFIQPTLDAGQNEVWMRESGAFYLLAENHSWQLWKRR
jgi:uncharacterized membrane protein